MSNKIYEDKLYNEERKIEFMEQYGKGTQKTIARVFKVSQVVESELEKDLADFNREELRGLFYLFAPSTAGSSNTNIYWVDKYISHCIEVGYKSGISPLMTISSEWKKQFVNESVKRFWTGKELDQVVDSRENAQDAVIIQLLREGVRGSGNSEILNLHKNSVDAFNNQLHLEDENGTKRTITVSDKLIKLCQQALNETEYSKMNGNASPDIKSPNANLVDNLFVVRNANTRTVHTEEADKSIVHRRLSKIAAEYSQSFTPFNVSHSGMLEMAKQRMDDHGSLTNEDVIEIAIQFGENNDAAIQRLKNEFLNEETVKELYSI